MEFEDSERYDINGVHYKDGHAWNVIHEPMKLSMKWWMASAIEAGAITYLVPATLLHVEVNNLLFSARNIADGHGCYSFGLYPPISGIIVAIIVEPNIYY